MASLYRPIASTSSHLFSRPLFRFSSTTSAFSPSGSTSADTKIPYGTPSLASSSYLPSTSPSTSDPATQSSPKDLTLKQREVLERIVRVDQAGELGANYIYMGQLAVLSRGKDKRVADLVQVRLLSSPRSRSCFLVANGGDSTCGTGRRSTLLRLTRSSRSME